MVLKRGPKKLPQTADLTEKASRLIRGDFERGTRRVYEKGRPRGYLNKLEPAKVAETIAITQLLQRNGIFVPRIKEIDWVHGIVHFESGGETLYHRLLRMPPLSPKQQRFALDLVSKFARMVGRVQSLGIAQGNTHITNVVIRGNQLGLIDFKFAKRVSPSIWKSVRSIYHAFEPDYRCFIADWPFLIRAGRSAEELRIIKQKMWERMVRQYPCTETIKKQLVNLLLQKP